MTDNEIIEALACCRKKECTQCPVYDDDIECGEKLIQHTIDFINRQKAEIERLQGFYKPTKTSGYKIENGKVVFYTNLLNGYRHEYKDLEEVVKELNMMLQRCYLYDDNTGYFKSKIKELRTEKNEAIKEFAERLKRNHITKDNKEKIHLLIEYDEFDNLVKEMTGGLENGN